MHSRAGDGNGGNREWHGVYCDNGSNIYTDKNNDSYNNK